MKQEQFGDWRAPPGAGAPSVLSTFSGCGGSSLGYRLAGCKVRLACEWEDNAIETYRLNFPDTPIHAGDIADLSVDRALRTLGMREGDLDILDGSPPCQGFSTQGKRVFDDPRNQLFREYVRLLEGLRPRAFVMENVAGMVKGKMRIIFAEILRTLRASGYRVRARVLNAKFFGVPQNRERIFFVGIREDLDVEPSHPRATGKIVSLRKALGGCPPADVQPPPLHRFSAKHWADMRPGDTLGKAMGTPNKYFSTWKLDPDRCSGTICKLVYGQGSMAPLHWAEKRVVSIAEVRRIASFPDDFRFVGTYEKQWARMGNCVPPLFMKAVASHVRGLLAKARA